MKLKNVVFYPDIDSKINARLEAMSLKPADVRESPAVDKMSFQDFNKSLGWPTNKNTDKRQKMAQYQIEYSNAIRNHHRVILNKTKKGGFTETVNRDWAQQVFDRYQGHDALLMAGNTANIALEVLLRIDELFQEKEGFTDQNGKRWLYGDLVYNINRSGLPHIEFYNGSRILATAASKSGRAQAVRGYDDIIAWFLTEAAHTGVTNDYPIYNGLTSLTANRDFGDQILESTPNGKRGFFYDTFQDATHDFERMFKMGNNGWYPMEYDYNYAVDAGIISRSFIAKEKLNPRIDFDQEYGCKFTTSLNAAFMDDEIRGLDEGESSVDLTTMLE